jgi:hypothetical protein
MFCGKVKVVDSLVTIQFAIKMLSACHIYLAKILAVLFCSNFDLWRLWYAKISALNQPTAE